MYYIRKFISNNVPQLVGLNMAMLIVILVIVARMHMRQTIILENSGHSLENQEKIKENQLENKEAIISNVTKLEDKLEKFSHKK